MDNLLEYLEPESVELKKLEIKKKRLIFSNCKINKNFSCISKKKDNDCNWKIDIIGIKANKGVFLTKATISIPHDIHESLFKDVFDARKTFKVVIIPEDLDVGTHFAKKDSKTAISIETYKVLKENPNLLRILAYGLFKDNLEKLEEKSMDFREYASGMRDYTSIYEIIFNAKVKFVTNFREFLESIDFDFVNFEYSSLVDLGLFDHFFQDLANKRLTFGMKHEDITVTANDDPVALVEGLRILSGENEEHVVLDEEEEVLEALEEKLQEDIEEMENDFYATYDKKLQKDIEEMENKDKKKKKSKKSKTKKNKKSKEKVVFK